MAEIFSVTVEEIIKQLNMEIIYAPENISSLVVTENDCNRPGLQLMGFMSISMQSVFRYAEIWSLLILLHLTRKQDMRG